MNKLKDDLKSAQREETERDRLHGERARMETERMQGDRPPIGGERLQGQPPTQERLSTADLARAGTSTQQQSEARLLKPAGAAQQQGAERAAPLFAPEVLGDLRTRWTDIQTGFVDEPRVAVEHADELVATTIKRLAESFADERQRLESEWARTGDVSTEDLRLALQRYRSFFDRLLNV